MRLIHLLPLLPAIAAASKQIPLGDSVQGWFDKAKSFVSSGANPAPVENTAEAVTDADVSYLNITNWQSVLAPKSKPEDWMIFITGGNKTCFGRCEQAEKAFNVRHLIERSRRRPLSVRMIILLINLRNSLLGICFVVCH